MDIKTKFVDFKIDENYSYSYWIAHTDNEITENTIIGIGRTKEHAINDFLYLTSEIGD